MPVKRSLKAAFARAGRLFAGSGRGRVVVLCYHSVHPTRSFASVDPARFVEHLRWLREHCELIGFGEALARARAGGGARPAVAVTFDDGYVDNAEFAAPLLAEHGVPATFFLTAGLIAGDPAVVERFACQRRSPRRDVRGMRWVEVRSIARAGFAVGAHTWSHPNLASLPADQVREELVRSKRTIEDAIGVAVDALAYPYGKPGRHLTARTVELAAEAGYRHGAAVLARGVRAADGPLTVPRFFVAGDSVDALAAKVRGDWDYLGWWQGHAPRWAARLVSPSDFAEEGVRA